MLVVFALGAASHRASHGQALESYLSQLRALVMFFLCGGDTILAIILKMKENFFPTFHTEFRQKVNFLFNKLFQDLNTWLVK